MRVLARLSVFALAPLVGGVCRATGVAVAAESASAVARFLSDRLSDQSLRVADALRDAADRAWATLDRALAGDSALAVADRAEDRAFREQLRLFVLAAQTDGRATADPTFVPRCRTELTAARAAGLLAGDADPVALADGLGTLTRFDEPTALLAAQWGVADALAADLHAEGFPSLASLVALRPPSDPTAAPLLAVAVRYYFRRSVEDDPKLFQGLAFAQLERLGKAQEDGAAQLAALMARYVERLEARLGELTDTALTTRAEVRALVAALASGGGQWAVGGGQAHPEPATPVLPSQPAAHCPLPTVLQVHTGAVACLAISPDGTRAVSGGADRGIVVWDLVARRELRVMAGHRDRVCCLAFGPDGRRVLSSSLDQTVRLWDADAGIELKTFDRQTNRSAAFAPDGTTALCGALYDGKLRLFDVATGKALKVLPGHADWVVGVAFAADGKLALSGGLDRAVKLWDVPTGRLLRTFALKNTILSSVAFSPDGWRVLSAGADGLVRVWDTFTGAELFRLVGHTDAVSCVSPAPDGDRAASAGHDGTVRVWDLRAKKELARFTGHVGNVLTVAFTPDGNAVLSGGDDGTVRVWALNR
ncbi:WD40 repeat domain-containing protein [Urbifossiella limnaea]|uniref:WD domain, G-beta repeat n=1 Tax=Urbifossiella limnaea TaxID=2528023 RepID=A0A517XS96_9BACT|nr:WD40 repeat domain-containing protein [Urbifossiella limnaea]QDU20379.1 WD domain, G-beta repeat [Urbifossiella limnaea]